MSKTIYSSDRKTRVVVAVGLFTALAYAACVVFHFRVSFLTFDVKDALMTVGAMLFGPLCGLAMCSVVSLIEMLTVSTTGLYGFIMNILSSVAFVCVGSLIYMRKRTMNGAIIGMLCSILAMTAVMLGANLVVTPFYTGVSTAEVAKMIPTLLLPFNLTKAIFNASLVFILYKPISAAVSRAGFAPVTYKAGEDGRSAVYVGKRDKKGFFSPVMIVALVLAVASLVFFFVRLGGSFAFG